MLQSTDPLLPYGFDDPEPVPSHSNSFKSKVFKGGGWREEGMTRTLYLPPVEGECGGPSAGHMLSVRASTPAGAQIEEVVH